MNGLVEIRLLGPVEVVSAGRRVVVGGPRVRAVLAILALSPNRLVPDTQLIDAVWGDEPPENANKVLQNCVLRLRKAVGGALIVRRPGGYELSIDPERIDLHRAQGMFNEGRGAQKAGRHRRAAALYTDALALWHGPALEELDSLSCARIETSRLAELRLAILEGLLDARLALGDHCELTGQLALLTSQEPLRERFWAQRMLALYRSGRQQDALRVYRELHELLDRELAQRVR